MARSTERGAYEAPRRSCRHRRQDSLPSRDFLRDQLGELPELGQRAWWVLMEVALGQTRKPQQARLARREKLEVSGYFPHGWSG